MIALGNTEIGKIYLGNNEVKRVYKGDNIIFDSKPYDAEIEYLENTYRDWINTGIKLTNDMGFKIVFEATTQTGAGYPICGVFQSSGGNLCLRFASSYLFVNYNGTTYVNTYVNKSTTVGNKTTVIVNIEHEVFVNNVKKCSFSRDTQVNESDFLLFRATGNSNYTPLKIYEFSLFTSNGTVFDGIPVRKGQVGYMYDKVSGQLFGNSGTGNFVLGEDLPYDARIEYLESDGNQWIDTLLYGDENTEVQIDFIPYEINKPIGFSRGNNTNDINLYITNSGIGGYQRFGNRAVAVKYTLGNRYNVILRNTKLFVNEEEYTFTASNSFTTPTTLLIFKTNANIKAKVFATKILKNNTVVFDGIPVRVGQVGYMYDKVSGELFGNSGTGNFILGNDI